MCTVSEPVNGTWTPTKRLTDEERSANARAAIDAAPADMSVADAPYRQSYGGNQKMIAFARSGLDSAMHNQRADADARHLASLPRQAATQAQAPSRTPNAAAGGGPSTLLTGGTAADALAAKKPRTSAPSLLGG